jgi:non-specific serine/threonine protein kinase
VASPSRRDGPLGAVRATLPADTTTLVGRETLVTQVERAVVSSRLVTLTGAGGVGKTRVAITVARSLEAAFRDGVWLIELAAVLDVAVVARTVAQRLGVRESSDEPVIESLARAIRERHLLLVLDNCEQVTEACAEIADALLRACSRLHLLTTSQRVLNLTCEVVWPVPPLGLPTRPGAATAQQLLNVPATRLFVDRATAALPSFVPTDQNAPAVAEICCHLDGIPLALELAAARVRSLTPATMASRLADRFRVVTAGPSAALPRHQTLRAMVDWSYELLNVQERTLFTRLAIFAGGWSLEAAEAVVGGIESERAGSAAGASAGSTGGASTADEPLDVVAVLTSLVDRSLVVFDATRGAGRYRFLETIREYALMRLREAGPAAEQAVRRAHYEWFAQVADAAAVGLAGNDLAEWLARLEIEHDNLRAAMASSLAEVDGRPSAVEAALRLARGLWRFWFGGGYLVEGRAFLTRVLALPSAGLPTRLRADLLFAAGRLAMETADWSNARGHLRACLDSAHALGADYREADALIQLGHLERGDGHFAEARALYEQGLAIHRRLGNEQRVAMALGALGSAAHGLGDFAEAQALYDACVTQISAVGERWELASALYRLGRLAADQGEIAVARGRYQASLRLWRAVGERSRPAHILEGLAALTLEEGRAENALRLAGAAAAIRAEAGASLPPVDRVWVEGLIARARSTLDPRVATARWTEGQSLDLDQAMAYGTGLGGATDAPVSSEPPPRVEMAGLAGLTASAGPLTAREHEIAVLIADGLTNRQIADRLVISKRTADNHVASILGKLAMRSRAQVARWITEQRQGGRR